MFPTMTVLELLPSWLSAPRTTALDQLAQELLETTLKWLVLILLLLFLYFFWPAPPPAHAIPPAVSRPVAPKATTTIRTPPKAPPKAPPLHDGLIPEAMETGLET